MNARPPQFGLKLVFAFVTWTAAVAGLAVSQFAGWTMTAVAFSVGALNCSGRLRGCQTTAGRSRLFGAGWTLLGLSLFLPAVKGCGNQDVLGWEAAVTCGLVVVDPPAAAAASSELRGVMLYAWLTFGNVLLLGSPFLLWRLQREGSPVYGTLLATAVATMCGLSIRDSNHVLVGYYAWCLGGLSLLCAYRIGWPTLGLMGLAVLLACLA